MESRWNPGLHPGRTACCNAAMTDRSRTRVLVVLAAVIVLMTAYWICWYADRSLVASNTRPAYYEFENAFPLADGWITLACLAAIVSLRRRSGTAVLWLLLAGGAGGYLFCMDSLYDVEHGIWWRSGAGGVIELVINIATVSVSTALVSWTWRHRGALSET